MASEDLLKKAVAAFNALSPEQQAEMLEDQRQSWVRGNIGLSRDERGMTSPVMPQPTTVMVSELKPWRYEIKYGPDGEDSYSWVYDDQGVMVAPMRTHKAKEVVDRMNTRPAPVATDTGLVTVGGEYLDGHTWKPMPAGVTDFALRGFKTRALCDRSQADELLAAERARYVEASQRATNEESLKDTMHRGLLRWKERAEKAETDNAALTARVKELEEVYERLEQQAIKDRNLRNEAQSDADLWRFSVDMGDQPSLLVKVWKQRKALEAKLAAAEKALERMVSEYDEVDLSHDEPPSMTSAVMAARAVLGGKPS